MLFPKIPVRGLAGLQPERFGNLPCDLVRRLVVGVDHQVGVAIEGQALSVQRAEPFLVVGQGTWIFSATLAHGAAALQQLVDRHLQKSYSSSASGQKLRVLRLN